MNYKLGERLDSTVLGVGSYRFFDNMRERVRQSLGCSARNVGDAADLGLWSSLASGLGNSLRRRLDELRTR